MGPGEPGRAGPQPPGDHRRRGGRLKFPPEPAGYPPHLHCWQGGPLSSARRAALRDTITPCRARYRSSSEGEARWFGVTRTRPSARFKRPGLVLKDALVEVLDEGVFEGVGRPGR